MRKSVFFEACALLCVLLVFVGMALPAASAGGSALGNSFYFAFGGDGIPHGLVSFQIVFYLFILALILLFFASFGHYVYSKNYRKVATAALILLGVTAIMSFAAAHNIAIFYSGQTNEPVSKYDAILGPGFGTLLEGILALGAIVLSYLGIFMGEKFDQGAKAFLFTRLKLKGFACPLHKKAEDKASKKEETLLKSFETMKQEGLISSEDYETRKKRILGH